MILNEGFKHNMSLAETQEALQQGGQVVLVPYRIFWVKKKQTKIKKGK